MTRPAIASSLASLLAAGAFLAAGPAAARAADAPLRVAVTFPAERSAQPIDGRLLLLISAETDGEPRLQVNDTAKTAQVFGVDVDGWKPGEPRVVDATAFGYPLRSLAALPKGTYRVQALINRYETFRRGDGVTRQAAARQGRRAAVGAQAGQPLFHAAARGTRSGAQSAGDPPRARPGNPAGRGLREAGNEVRQVRADPQRAALEVLGSRHVSRPRGCCCPGASTTIPDARYPLVINHGHFPSRVSRVAGDAAGPRPEAATSANAFSWPATTGSSRSWRTSSTRTGRAPGFPRVLLIEIQHATPFYDDSYAVNSANNGPYGDAIMFELVPEIERRFRGLGTGMGAIHLRRIDRRMGSDGGADVLPGRLQRRVGRLSRSDRLPPLHRREHLRRRRTPTTCRGPSSACRGRGCATTSVTSPPRSSR